MKCLQNSDNKAYGPRILSSIKLSFTYEVNKKTFSDNHGLRKYPTPQEEKMEIIVQRDKEKDRKQIEKPV